MTGPSDCPACSGQWPRTEQRIADFGESVAYLHDDQFFPGWTVLVLKRHATELFALTPSERATLMEEVSRVAQALASVFDAAYFGSMCVCGSISRMESYSANRRWRS